MLSVALVVKNPLNNAGDIREVGSTPGWGKISWRRAWQPTPVFLPGKACGQRNLVGYSPQGHRESETAEATWHTHTQTPTSKQSMAAVNPTQKWSLMTVIDRDSSRLWKYQFSSPPQNTAAPHSLAGVCSVVLQHLPSRYQMWPGKKGWLWCCEGRTWCEGERYGHWLLLVSALLGSFAFCSPKLAGLAIFVFPVLLLVFILVYVCIMVLALSNQLSEITPLKHPWKWKWRSLSPVQLFATPWTSPGQNTGVGSFTLLQRIFLTQGSNPGLLHCRQILCLLSPKGSP